MPTFSRFEDMDAWQVARGLARRIYEVTDEGELRRDFGLKDQMRRASVSIMSNIAEGFESRTQGQFVEYLGRAKASSGELRAQLYLALDVRYLDETAFVELRTEAEKCSRQLRRLMEYLNRCPDNLRIREDGPVYELALPTD